MKKRIKYFASLFILLLPFFITASCSASKKPWAYNNVVWSSEQPEIEITKKTGEDWTGYIVVDGNKQMIELIWGQTYSFRILEINEGDRTQNVVTDDITLLKGKVRFNSKSVTLIIKVDNVFNNEFDKIILTRRDL
jgi:hypothetical protein